MKELIQIQNELKANKSQYNKFGKYNYRSAEDILEALKPHLLKHECICVITEDVRCVGAYTFIHTIAVITNKDGQTITSTGTAGIEKAGGMALPQAFGSASSYAKKYALGNLFLLDDTKDADAINNHGKKTTTAPKKTKAEIADQIRQGIKNSKTVNELNVLYGTLRTNWQTEMKPEFAQRRKEIEA